jgi:hypothetical protein
MNEQPAHKSSVSQQHTLHKNEIPYRESVRYAAVQCSDAGMQDCTQGQNEATLSWNCTLICIWGDVSNLQI